MRTKKKINTVFGNAGTSGISGSTGMAGKSGKRISFLCGLRAVAGCLLLLVMLLFAPARLSAAGWTPSDCGLVVSLERNDRILLSVMIDKNNDGTQEEYFLCHYPSHQPTTPFNYKSYGDYFKLIQQSPTATEPSPVTVWTIDSAATRIINNGGVNYNFALGGISYTMWSSSHYTPSADGGWQFMGKLVNNIDDANLCDVVFGIPTVQSRTNVDPNNTTKRGYPFNSRTGVGFLGMVYREVYMFEKPRQNSTNNYTNTALVCMDTVSGKATWAYADSKYNNVKRTLFRLYILSDPHNFCPDGYFFAYNQQDYVKYRVSKYEKDKIEDYAMADSTEARKIYIMDRLYCMERDDDPSSSIQKTDYMFVPKSDSAFYYVGYRNDFRSAREGESMGPNEAVSAFKNIDSLRVYPLKDAGTLFAAPQGAYGKMVIDTLSAYANHAVSFEPAGYFLQVTTDVNQRGLNIPMRKTGDNEWTSDVMWTITGDYASRYIRAVVYTKPEFSSEDPGGVIEGWSEYQTGTSISVLGGGDLIGTSGWGRIYTNNSTRNGAMVLVPANTTMHVEYNNNGLAGAAVPDDYPEGTSSKTVTLRSARLNEGFRFDGWAKSPSGPVAYAAGETIRIDTVPEYSDGVLTLYAKGAYTRTYNVALSFMQGGKRYFLQQPGSEAPRYSRARTYGDWTNVWQGMANAENNDPNYLATYEMRHPDNEIKAWGAGVSEGLLADEYVLDPRRDTLRSYNDSLILYEPFAPSKDMFIGLYYQSPNTVVANNTWAGLFRSSEGWPDYTHPSVRNTKLYSTRYVYEADPAGHPDELTLALRSNASEPYVTYMPATNQFDGKSSGGTDFDLLTLNVADAHYIILPDTTKPWNDTVVFGFHEDEQIEEPLWTYFIGKHLKAFLVLGTEIGDTIYFHPDPDKVLTTPQELYFSTDFRLSQSVTLIRDARVEALGVVETEDKATLEETGDYWLHNITSGMSSPVNVLYGGDHVDIYDTVRVRLSLGGLSNVKKFYGRWGNNAAGLHVSADGMSRYRDIIVRTKTYYYGDNQKRYILTPEHESYIFNPLAGQSMTLRFMLTEETYRKLYDVDDNEIREEIVAIDTITAKMALMPSYCKFATTNTAPGTDFASSVSTREITVSTIADNSEEDNLDTLKISRVRVDGVEREVDARIPLRQTSLFFEELVWSAVDSTTMQRYYIMAGRSGFIFRRFTQKGTPTTLYQYGTSTALIQGSGDGHDDSTRYITPWKFRYVPDHSDQLKLFTEYGVNKYFCIKEGAPALSATDSSALSYRYVSVFVNSNANEEELIRLKYGTDKWLKMAIDGAGKPYLKLQDDSLTATVFSWSYMDREYSLANNGTYPDNDFIEFSYNNPSSKGVKTRYQAWKEFSMLVGNKQVFLCREKETNVANLRDEFKEWLTNCSITCIPDARDFDTDPDSVSRITTTTNYTTLITTVTATGPSPMNVQIGGEYVNIVDTLNVVISLRKGAPAYRFKDAWKDFASVDDACLKIPLIRKTFHTQPFDSLVCDVEGEEYNYTFPSSISTGVNDTHTFTFTTTHRKGVNIMNVDNSAVAVTDVTSADSTRAMRFTDPNYTEIRLVDEYGNIPTWCEITGKTNNTITVRCKESGTRSPRTAYIIIAYIVYVKGDMRFVNYRLTVSQNSLFQYANNQHLIHTRGASGDPMVDGMQQVHENKRILYYYPDQKVELPVRERGFYGWWRWYREGDGEIGDSDIPNYQTPPRNVGKYNYPYRVIGDSVWINPEDHSEGKKLVTMGRYTVFRHPSKDYGSVKADPPAKVPLLTPQAPNNKVQLKYAVDISNYYDNLPLSMKNINQIDTAMLDTLETIYEPTLSLREVFELHPWTEMAAKMELYKDTIASPRRNMRYMEDHVVLAPTGNRLLLQTEQRYNYENLKKNGHSESLLGYYMRDDNWASMSDVEDGDGWSRKDSMIWCGGWDVDCKWYFYNPAGGGSYSPCNYTITDGDDFLSVPAKGSISVGKDADTVYFCLRARSKKSKVTPPDDEVDGDYWFNICRYMVIYYPIQKYGPVKEQTTKGVTKAIITNDEIEQDYEVLERLNFDYNKPGKDYHVYPHPLPWADASYGYCYPESHDVPHNRFHDESDFPNMGEYGLINKIPYTTWWNKMEQHGGAENGYMIYCDGMSSPGQVAALTLKTHLCEGQKMYFSGYVGNPHKNDKVSKPNFIFSVQGSNDGVVWNDITSYMTGDIPISDKWYQIYFPITQEMDYTHFRVRIYNVSSSFDGNDFVIDDMCIFATKPPMIAYQANTMCVEEGKSDSITQVMLRVDYQGFTEEGFNDHDVYYTIEQEKDEKISFVPMLDGYMNGDTIEADDPAKPDTIYGYIPMPAKDYEPQETDSVFRNMTDFVNRFLATYGTPTVVRRGFIYENLDGDIRPVMYILHKAKMTPDNTYRVRMSAAYKDLMKSICAMTSELKVTSRMVLELNGEEQKDKNLDGICGNTIYDIGLRVKGSLYVDSVAPIELSGSCKSDWLLYGDTTEATSRTRYGYTYRDIVKVVNQILRGEAPGVTNTNQFAPDLPAVNANVMKRMQENLGITLTTSKTAYEVLTDLVNNGFLLMYQSHQLATIMSGDSLQYVVMPILNTGRDETHKTDVDVCPQPLFIKLKPKKDSPLPMMIGGVLRDSTQKSQPVDILTDSVSAIDRIVIPIDSIMPTVALYSIDLVETNDPNFHMDVEHLDFLPDREYDFHSGGDNSGYYKKGENIILRPAATKDYNMRQGYSYTFNIVMQTRTGALTRGDGCPVGIVPFTVSIVPDRLMWNPYRADNNHWNSPDNWIGITSKNLPIHERAHFVPLSTSSVIIPTLSEGMPYPELPNPASISKKDSVKMTGFQYNTCDLIRFMPGAAMREQQRLTCNGAVIDMSLPYNTWAFRSAPVAGMISGDIFMSEADLRRETTPWEVGAFDASGRNAKTGNATYWLSVYSRKITQKGNDDNVKDSVRNADADWSRVVNGMTLSLPPAHGWAIYARTASKTDAVVRLPKNDDVYYYFTVDGDVMEDSYEYNLQKMRNDSAFRQIGGSAGDFAYRPATTYQNYTITNDTASTSFVFGNPTMGYIDIWGFLADNGLTAEVSYMASDGKYTTVTKGEADLLKDTITAEYRYLPPMHAMVVTATKGKILNVRLNTNRVITAADQIARPLPASAPAPRHTGASGVSKGLMTVTAMNPASSRCTSELVIGQGFHADVIEGEDAILTTLNIDHYSATSAPATPFNIYAVEKGCALSVDLTDEVLNVPLSFCISNLPFEPVTHLWFTGVNAIDGGLVLYDALTGTERPIIDGSCLDIETPEVSYEMRYYIRRRGYNPDVPENPVTTNVVTPVVDENPAVKIFRNGYVFILRNGHVYTVLGQKIR